VRGRRRGSNEENHLQKRFVISEVFWIESSCYAIRPELLDVARLKMYTSWRSLRSLSDEIFRLTMRVDTLEFNSNRSQQWSTTRYSMNSTIALSSQLSASQAHQH